MLEKDFQKQVIDYLKNKNAFIINVEGLERGLPDLVVCHQGKFIGLELKVDYKIQPHQVLQLQRIRNAGGLGYELKYCFNWQDILDKMLTGEYEQELKGVNWNE